jgi:hypothetical protein
MFYIVWLVTAFIAVGAGCAVAGIVDRKNPKENQGD